MSLARTPTAFWPNHFITQKGTEPCVVLFYGATSAHLYPTPVSCACIRPGPDGQTWLSGNQCSLCDRCANPRQLKVLVEPELRSPHCILDLMFDHQLTLLFDMEESAAGPPGNSLHPAPATDLPITLELVESLRQWDRKQKFFRLEGAEFLGQIARGQLSLSNAYVAGKVRWMVGRAMQKSFHFQEVTDR